MCIRDRWENDWPVIGEDKDGDGCGEPVKRYKKPDVGRIYPCLLYTSYVSPADRASVLQKVKNEPWAGEAFAAIRSKVEKRCV